MGLAQGANLVAAQGSITINTTQAQQAVPVMQQVATGIMNAFTGINTQANTAQQGISNVTRVVTGLAGAFGISFGAQGVVQLGKMAIEATAVATAYDRQKVAAAGLAGSQQNLNQLLATYRAATGGAIDNATALADVTKDISLGFANNAKDLDDFARAARGIALAGFGGGTQSSAEEQLQAAIISQRRQSLRDLGLEYDKVKARANELQTANSSLSNQMAYGQAVIEQATKKFGDLAASGPGAATGIEKAAASGKNLTLVFGELIGPTVNAVGDDVSRTLDRWQAGLEAAKNLATALGIALGAIKAPALTGPIASRSGLGSRVEIQQVPRSMSQTFSDEQNATKLDWAKGISDLNQKTNEDLLQQNSDYQRQRADSEHQYQQSTLRANEDFGLQRQREEQDLADSISRIHRDSAQREEREGEDLARSISQAQTDSADRVAKAKSDANERLTELDENYQRDREKAARHFHDSIIESAGRLDAKAVAEAQRNFNEQQQDAKDAHDDQRDKLQKQLGERLDDESKSLAKSIAQQQDAYNRQLQDGRDADAQRIADMQTDFGKRTDQENQDYGIRFARAQQDHNDQLTEMDRAQGLRIQQIIDHAQADRTQLDDEHKTAMIALGVHNQDWIDAQTKKEQALEKLWDGFFNHVGGSMTGKPGTTPQISPGGFDGGAFDNAYAVPASYNGGGGSTVRNSSVGNISFTIVAGPNATPNDIADVVDARLTYHLKEWAA